MNWIKFSEQGPTMGDCPIEICDGKKIDRVNHFVNSHLITSAHSHWRKANNDFPPVENPDEAAFGEWLEANNERAYGYADVWFGAIAWERARKWDGDVDAAWAIASGSILFQTEAEKLNLKQWFVCGFKAALKRGRGE